MAIILPQLFIDQPSFDVGWATSAALSSVPEQWEGLICAWAPVLGPTGTLIYDLVNRQADVLMTNMAVASDWVAEATGWGIDLDGTDDFLTTASPVLNNLFPCTLMVWCRPRTSGQNNFGCMYTKGTSGNTVGTLRWLFNGNTAQGRIELAVQRSGAVAESTTDGGFITFGQPTHLACTIDTDGTNRQFINGIEPSYAIGPLTGSGTFTDNSNSNWRIGDWATSTTHGNFNGVFYEGRVYNRLIDPERIEVIAADPLALWRPAVRWWAVPEEAGGITYNQTFTGNTTPTGAVPRQGGKRFGGQIGGA